MGGGGGNDPKERESKRALAEQAAVSLQRYGEVFVPLENMYIQDQLNRFGDSAYQDVMGRQSTQIAGVYEQGLEDLDRGAFNRGLDPTSGSYIAESDALRTAQARGMGLGSAAAGIGNTDMAYGGLMNVVRAGQGLQTDSMQGNLAMAESGLTKARAGAQEDFARSQSIQSIAGTAVGMAGAYGLNRGTT